MIRSGKARMTHEKQFKETCRAAPTKLRGVAFCAAALAVGASASWQFWRGASTTPVETGRTAPVSNPQEPAGTSEAGTAGATLRRISSLDIPLAPGARLPPLEADGWLNGPGPPADGAVGRVIVVDVFDELCPVCGMAAPALVDLREKYRGEGVEFVSLTYAGFEPAERFARQSGISWPVGYGAGKTITALVGPAPTVFVVGSDGRITWHDDRSRSRHATATFRDDIDAAIVRALGGDTGSDDLPRQ